jgi:hypothetical protein
VGLKFDHIPANTAELVRIRKVLSWNQRQQFNIAATDYIGQWDWQICRESSVVTSVMADPEYSQAYLGEIKLCVLHSVNFEMCMQPQVSGASHICN